MLLVNLIAGNSIFHQLVCGRNDPVMYNRIVWIRRSRLSLDHRWNSTVAAGVTPCCVVDVGIGRLVPSIFLCARISILLPHSWILGHHRLDGFGNVMAFSFMDRVELIQRRQQKCGGEFKLPVISNSLSCISLPYLYGRTPPVLPTGHPTTTSPSRISCF
jgi:hypothetical protein